MQTEKVCSCISLIVSIIILSILIVILVIIYNNKDLINKVSQIVSSIDVETIDSINNLIENTENFRENFCDTFNKDVKFGGGIVKINLYEDFKMNKLYECPDE